MSRLREDGIVGVVSKLDIITIADRENEGYFAAGTVLLSEVSLSENHLPMRCFYLLARALLGMITLSKGHSIVTLNDTLTLNKAVLDKFEEFRNYLFLKNCKYQELREIIEREAEGEYFTQNEAHFLQFHAKAVKFIVRGDLNSRVSFELASIMTHFSRQTRD